MLLYALGICVFAASYLFTYSYSSVKALDNAVKNYDDIRKIKPCDTSAYSMQVSTEKDIAKSVILSTKIESLASIEDLANGCIFILYNLVGFIIITYVSVYVTAYKQKHKRDKVNNSTPETPS